MTLKKEAGEKHKQASKELLYDDGIRVFGTEIRNFMQKKISITSVQQLNILPAGTLHSCYNDSNVSSMHRQSWNG
jgi:hypothetical protein